jgi:hypothetical protein
MPRRFTLIEMRDSPDEWTYVVTDIEAVAGGGRGVKILGDALPNGPQQR